MLTCPARVRSFACSLFVCFSLSCSDHEEEPDCAVEGSQEALSYACSRFDYEIETDPNAPDYGQLPCRALTLEGYTKDCLCDDLGFSSVSAKEADLVAEHMAAINRTDPACQAYPPCVCELTQFKGADLEQCHTEGILSNLTGWCILEPALGLGTEEAAFGCEQRLRMLGRAQLYGVMMCDGKLRDADFNADVAMP